MTAETVLSIMFFFIVKHFIIDCVMNPPHSMQDTSLSTRVLVVMHSLYHSVISFVILSLFFGIDNYVVWLVCLAELVIHYVIDYYRITFSITCKLSQDAFRCEQLVNCFDDFLHYTTYVLMIAICI